MICREQVVNLLYLQPASSDKLPTLLEITVKYMKIWNHLHLNDPAAAMFGSISYARKKEKYKIWHGISCVKITWPWPSKQMGFIQLL